MKKVLFCISVILLISSCTENDRARNYGGTEEIKLNRNEELVTMTWKETNLWVLTKDTTTGISYFREHSSWGVIEGEIIIK